MEALGLIETRGLLAAIESADVMLKTAQVKLSGRTLVGGGLVSVIVTGDVGAVQAAVEAGAAAAAARHQTALVSRHIIPRPHDELAAVLQPPTLQTPAVAPAPPAAAVEEAVPPAPQLPPLTPQQLKKAVIDALVSAHGWNAVKAALAETAVVKLRNLAREYKELAIAGRAISKANKELLIQSLKDYYES